MQLMQTHQHAPHPGLMWLAVSVYQMLRGSEVVFTALLTVSFLKRRLTPWHAGGLALVVAGACCCLHCHRLASGLPRRGRMLPPPRTPALGVSNPLPAPLPLPPPPGIAIVGVAGLLAHPQVAPSDVSRRHAFAGMVITVVRFGGGGGHFRRVGGMGVGDGSTAAALENLDEI